uniref:Uncharacterized protein n=1 Tax=Anguilla anguilla TaxID=7936 RepID=A0A0E9QD10_ANGAN
MDSFLSLIGVRKWLFVCNYYKHFICMFLLVS